MNGIDSRPQHHVSETLRRSWGMFAARFWTLFLGFFVMTLVLNIASGVTFGLATLVITGPLWLGVCNMALSAVRSDEVRVGDAFSGFKQFLPALGIWLLLTLFAGLGTLLFALPTIILSVLALSSGMRALFVIVFAIGGTLCMVPGSAVAVLYAPSFFFVGDQALGVWDAMERSRKMVANNLGRWVWLWLGLSAIAIAIVFIGLLLAIAIFALITWTMGFLAAFSIGLVLASIVFGLPSFAVTPWMLVALALAYEREQSALAAVPAESLPPGAQAPYSPGLQPPPLGAPQRPLR